MTPIRSTMLTLVDFNTLPDTTADLLLLSFIFICCKKHVTQVYIVVLKKGNGERHKHSDMTTNYTFLYYSEVTKRISHSHYKPNEPSLFNVCSNNSDSFSLIGL